ncbi:symbiosis receptor-like kinase precursor [Solanum lycopersicum]|uniref:Symbiosis receptor-like kinase n=1 Tax=Solanum lycopersicum TaxID=4081 RepID=Q2TDW9_SOLLC|nr:symbiosis receptor-like kinase precursor [Solanum lycopersicum]AAY22055.1 symbiosis receptor-like kinase [Solanum lycopersicum]AAY22389.1 symbiosis receptor-like kinase [Solanum lycopersicum]
MEVDNCWNIRLVNCVIICLVIYIQSAFAQEGFLSIQCCATANFTEPRTNLSWISDGIWFPENQSCISRPVYKSEHYERARSFSSDISHKWCYSLPTRKEHDYLVRGTFLSVKQEKTLPHSSFVVLIGVTPIATVKSSDELKVEGIFRATRSYTNFCLLKKKGNPYISKVELRPINSDYLKKEPSEILKLVHRVDAGNKAAEIRYPYDQYDRIWRPASNLESQVTQTPPSIIKHVFARKHSLLPPAFVLRTALTHPERLDFLHEDLDTGYYTYSLFLYFLEPNDSVQAGERVFYIYINNEKRLKVDILASGSRYLDVVLNFRANRSVNLTMIKASNLSQLGPICNGYEILKALPRVKETATEEVDIMANVKKELLQQNKNNEIWKSWSGDPCLPLPWPGLTCDRVNGTSVITQIDLSSGGLSGPSPPSIQKLMHLRKLNISINGSSGTNSLFTSYFTYSTRYLSSRIHISNKLSRSIKESNITTDKGMANVKQNSSSTHKLVIGAAVGTALLVILAIVISVVCLFKRRVMAGPKFLMRNYSITRNAVYSVPSMDTTMMKSISSRNFKLEYIEAITQNYKTLIGEGGFGSVYRGTLPDGVEVAVKVRSATSTQGIREFNNELNLLSAITHENLVPLIGYCCENEQQILVYPFMSNSSLQDRLYGGAAKRKILDWPARLSIALGAARGLLYLHTFSERCLIHRDVKSSNILLDQSMCAKVADFGFSKYASQEGDSGTSLEVRGTAGYLDPEYYSTQRLSAKSDVFSFGVVLLEILTGREPLNINKPRNEWSLVEWAKPLIRSSRVEEIVDPTIKGGYHGEALWRVVEVALACTETYSTYRPCMADIVRELEDALIIENNASEYLKSLDSFGGSNRFSVERSIVLPPIKSQTEPSSLLSKPAPPQPR